MVSRLGRSGHSALAAANGWGSSEVRLASVLRSSQSVMCSKALAAIQHLEGSRPKLYPYRDMANLTAEKALIFRITHINNVPWILRHGLHCKNSGVQDPNFVRIGNLELIQRRTARNVPVPPGGTLSDYIPFYFTPFSMMMYNIKTGYGGIRQFPNAEIVIMASSLRGLADRGVATVFSDRHAYLQTAQFFTSLDDLDKIDWGILQRRDFKRDVDDPEKTDRYQAEALVHRHLPVERLAGIVCLSENEKGTLERQREEVGLDLKIVARPGWYF